MPSLKRDQNGLTEMQRQFIHHYVAGRRGVRYIKTRAAIEAGYSKRTAYSIGSELTKKPHVAAMIEQESERLGWLPWPGEETT